MAERSVVFNGGPYQSYWWNDEHLIMHPTIRAELVDEIDVCSLEAAWDKTLGVYPLLDLVPRVVEEEVVFCKAPGCVVPVRSSRHLRPGTEAVGGRAVSLTYWGATLTLSIYHSVVDTRGLLEVFRTLLALYAELHAGLATDSSRVMLEQGRAPEQYFVQSTMLIPADYTPRPVTLYRSIGRVFCDECVGEDSEDGVTVAQVCLPYAELVSVCGEQKATTDVLLLYATARSIYGMHPDDRRDLSLAVECDFRETFAVQDSIAPCSCPVPCVVTHEEVMEQSMQDALATIAARRAQQVSRDYICSHLAMENTFGLLDLKRPCIVMSGTYDVRLGEATDHLRRIEFYDCSLRTARLLRLGDSLLINLQYGRRTQAYADALVATLRELGVDAGISAQPHMVPAEVASPVVESGE